MRTKLFFMLALVCFFATCHAQENPAWEKWNWLLGEWVGEGSGQPGSGGGTFSFNLDLDKNILVIKSHSEYTAAENKPKVTHNDLMIVYLDYTGTPLKAIYFDNEGHTINYMITYAEKAIVLKSEKIPNVPGG